MEINIYFFLLSALNSLFQVALRMKLLPGTTILPVAYRADYVHDVLKECTIGLVRAYKTLRDTLRVFHDIHC